MNGKSLAVVALGAFMVAGVTQNEVRGRYNLGPAGSNDAVAALSYSESGGAPVIEYQFTTSDTVEYSMSPTTFNIGTNTITANGTAMSVGDIVVSWAQGGTAADALDTQFFIADKAYTVKEINVVWGVAESTGAMDVMVERLQGTEACAAGDNLQTAVVDATATANTVTTPALTGTTANLSLAAGNRLCVDLTATPNEVTNLVVSVLLGVG